MDEVFLLFFSFMADIFHCTTTEPTGAGSFAGFPLADFRNDNSNKNNSNNSAYQNGGYIHKDTS